MTRSKATLGLTIAIDVILINVAFVLSYIIRYDLDVPYPVPPQFDAPFVPYYVPFAALLTVLCLLMYRIDGLYDRHRRRRPLEEIYRIGSGTATSIVAMLAITFFVQPEVYSRGMLIVAGVLIVASLTLTRLIEHLVLAARRRKGIGVEQVLVIGAGEAGRAVMQTILASPGLGYRIAGYLDDDPNKKNGLGRIKHLGELSQLEGVLTEFKIDEVIVTLPWQYYRKIMHIMDVCDKARVRCRLVPDVFQRRMYNVDIENLNGIPLISPGPDRLPSEAYFAKRAGDILLSIIALPFFLVLLPIIAVLIKLDSPGPVFFKQERIGKDGRAFTVYKFRTMVDGADMMKSKVAHLNRFKGDTLLKVVNDPRVTKVGRFLRRTSLDELPQVINVLRGEMSWVGPRPNTPDEVVKYEVWQRKRLNVLPGITGLWQVSGRSDVPFDEMCLLDIFYIENWSLGLDARIILQTIPRILFGSGAY
ncbi:MAG: sugar transferase [Chloroflexi bacterium]|nr:sugar transferase [Chloroflexota bacterium]